MPEADHYANTLLNMEENQFPFRRRDTFHPAPELAELRKDCPVARVKLFDGKEVFLLTKAKHCREVLERLDISADRRAPGYPEVHAGGTKAKEERPTFVNLDNPEHDKQRAVLTPLFGYAAVEDLKSMMCLIIHDIIDKMVAKHAQNPDQPIDLVADFAVPVPTKIIYKILAVPDEDIEMLSKDSEIRTSTSRDAAQSSNVRLREYIKNLVGSRATTRLSGGETDVISVLLHAWQQGRIEKLDDVNNLAFLVLVAGNAALINTIALGVLTLLQHPEQLATFKNDPEIASNAVSEILRYHTTSALNCRRATTKRIEIGGVEIPPQTGLICAVQSADRDSDAFKNPNTFDIHREIHWNIEFDTINNDKIKPSSSLGFGWGTHRCLGEWLSRKELECALVCLFSRLPELRLADGVSVEDLKYTPAEQNVGLLELPVVWWSEGSVNKKRKL